MRKLFLYFFFLFCLFFIKDLSFWASCSFSPWQDIWNSVENCVDWTEVFIPTSDAKAEWWLKDIVIKWVKSIWTVLSLFAVASIVIWSYFMVFSFWNDEKVKKWKDIVKWWALWFLALISAWWIITFIVNVMYSF